MPLGSADLRLSISFPEHMAFARIYEALVHWADKSDNEAFVSMLLSRPMRANRHFYLPWSSLDFIH
jgi:hypothetical protein